MISLDIKFEERFDTVKKAFILDTEITGSSGIEKEIFVYINLPNGESKYDGIATVTEMMELSASTVINNRVRKNEARMVAASKELVNLAKMEIIRNVQKLIGEWSKVAESEMVSSYTIGLFDKSHKTDTLVSA